MDKISLPPYTLHRTEDGLVATHEGLSKPVPVSEILLLRVIKTATRQALDFHGRAGMVVPRTSLKKSETA